MRLAEIHVYPVKGARGIALERTDVLAGGLRHDRRFMVVGDDGSFLTQRTEPRLALVETALEEGGRALALTASGRPERVTVDLAALAERATSAPRRRVTVWDDDVDAIEAPGDASLLFSRHLGRACTLVFMPDDVVRPVEAPHGRAGDRVGFADAYPVLIATRASLADLNARLEAAGEPAVAMSRFRPNLVVEGGEAYGEDRHSRVRVGALTFRTPKRCARCTVTTVDQLTAEVGKEPLRTLASYRSEGNKVHFALNAIPEGEGAIAVGDAVSYIDTLRA